MDRETDFQVPCAVCEHEVPLSEALVREASDYMAYFCGLECYERWRKHAAAVYCVPKKSLNPRATR